MKSKLFDSVHSCVEFERKLAELLEIKERAFTVFEADANIEGDWQKYLENWTQLLKKVYDEDVYNWMRLNMLENRFYCVAHNMLDKEFFFAHLSELRSDIDSFVVEQQNELLQKRGRVGEIYDAFMKENAGDCDFIFGMPEVKEIVIAFLFQC